MAAHALQCPHADRTRDQPPGTADVVGDPPAPAGSATDAATRDLVADRSVRRDRAGAARRRGSDDPALRRAAGAGAERRGADGYDDDDEDDERPRHPYTWLHFIVLALVAFVLGFLIVLLLSQRGARPGTPRPTRWPPRRP